MNMILMGTGKKFPNCTVIVSHVGGTLPYLINRVVTPLKKVLNIAASASLGTTYDQAMADMCSFHYDPALSSPKTVLDMVLDIVPHDHILYGVSSPQPLGLS